MSADLDSTATKIQRFMRNWYGKRRGVSQLRSDVDSVIHNFETFPIPATDIFIAGQKLLFNFDIKRDKKRFMKFSKVILAGMETDDVKVWYVSLSLDRSYAVDWMKQIKKLLALMCCVLRTEKLREPEDIDDAETSLSFILNICDYSLWKLTPKAGSSMKPLLHQLCVTFVDYLLENNFYFVMNHILLEGLHADAYRLSPPSLSAAMGVRLLAIKNFAPDAVIPFICHVLSVPASILHLHHCSPQVIEHLQKVDFLSRVVKVLLQVKSFATGLNSNSATAIVCNILYLAAQGGMLLVDESKKSDFLHVMLELLPMCQEVVGLESQSYSSFWHPLFGWCKGTMDARLLKLFTHVPKQLQYMWNPAFLDIIFSDLLEGNFKEVSKKKHPITLSNVCEMYLQFVAVVKNFASDILIGLGCNETIVYKMWHFFKATSGLQFKEICRMKLHANMLSLFSQMMLYLLNILDDYDLFEKQKSFKPSDLAEISMFLNNFLFYIIWEQKELIQFSNCQALLSMLYNRDCKKHFCRDEQWHIRGFRVRQLIKELESGTHRGLRILTQLPHIYPRRKRVEVFHQRITKDKERLGISGKHPTTYISIHRDKLLEDGYNQLGQLSNSILKGTIRVKFINAQGLDEAGIDEMGVFKEFLEETLKLAFNPAIELFKTNAEGHLFPSSSSGVNENHLQLFEFIGKMLGKAVYEGIVIDIPLAPFFLSHLLQNNHSTFYNYLDELASFDQEMYSSLNFVKRYDGDVTDLCLMFSVDEEFLGKTITHELIDGGSAIPVTSSNRLSYIHRMAQFKLFTRVKKQTVAFTRGFHCLIEPSLTQFFSPRELHNLVCGDETDFDVDDLRKYTEYLGGYHANHKVILWLWDILKRDFNAVERGQLLKFVTSCSRPPLLGFKHLHPPFTVRCIQMTFSEDTEESLAGMIKGFFSRHQSKDRLPSSSTCFNILKLPNYTKQSVLRDKLKYAIQANCGFELS